jgi:small-conductance mechanosensitive channel
MESIEEINTQIKNLDEQIGQLIAYFNSILAEFGHPDYNSAINSRFLLQSQKDDLTEKKDEIQKQEASKLEIEKKRESLEKLI